MVHDTINNKWFPAKIKSPRAEPNSYDITTSEGVTYRHSCHHPKPCIPRLPSLNENDHNQNEVQHEVQDSENKSQPITEGCPHHSKKPVHRYIKEF